MPKFTFKFAALLAAALQASFCLGAGQHYLFRGYFAPTNRLGTPEFVSSSPSELMGRPFAVRISWPDSPDEYALDLQTGADYWGSYRTEAIAVEINVPGFDFTAPPVIYSWESWNDTALDYHLGTPLPWGDELRLEGRADLRRTHDFIVIVDGQPRTETISWTSEYQLTFRAIDDTGSRLNNDSLQAELDLTSFGDVRFEFQQVVPVRGSDPRPIHYQHWLGIVEEIVAVPEPSSAMTAGVVIAGVALSCRLRARRSVVRISHSTAVGTLAGLLGGPPSDSVRPASLPLHAGGAAFGERSYLRQLRHRDVAGEGDEQRPVSPA